MKGNIMKKITYTIQNPTSNTGEIIFSGDMTNDEIKLAILKDSGIKLSVSLVEEKPLIMDEVIEPEPVAVNTTFNLTEDDFNMFVDFEELEEIKPSSNQNIKTPEILYDPTTSNNDKSDSYDPYYVGRIVWQTYQDKNGNLQAGGRVIDEILENGDLVIKSGSNDIKTKVARNRVFTSKQKCMYWIENTNKKFRQENLN